VEANRQLEALSRLKDEFVSSVSHELRTPITSIKLYHQLMQLRPDKLAKYHGQLGREIDRLSDLIEDLLQLSRIDQGFLKLDLGALDLNALAAQYVADRQLLAQEHGLALEYVGSEEPIAVLADESVLGQVLSILLTNAINYTPPDGKIELRVDTCERDDALWGRVDVSDTGLGISAEEMPSVFDRFFRGRAGNLSKAPGTGLGLAIAKESVEGHGGSIAVASPGRLGSGSTFSIWLPVISDPE
jgi:signal transduction histidine kinase